MLKDNGIQDKHKAFICTQLADTDKCLTDGADETLQLMAAASVMQQILQGRYG